MTRPGVTSRRDAISSRASHRARAAPTERRPRSLWTPETRRHASWRTAGSKSSRWSNSWRAQVGLAGLLELGGHQVAQLDEDLDVEGGVLQPRLGQRARGPVGGGVLLAHPLAQQGLDQGGEPDAGVAEQAAGELGVEERGGLQADLAQAGEVLGRGVQDPLGAGEGLLEGGQGLEGDRVDQPGAGALAAQLDEVGAGRVAVARRPLGVDGDRAGGRGERLAGLGEARLGVGDPGQPVAQGQQRDLGGLGLRDLAPSSGAVDLASPSSGSGVVLRRDIVRSRADRAGSGWR